MAITFIGKSMCPICNQIIIANEEITLFPSFIQNTKDPLYVFNDVGVHCTCLNLHPLNRDAIKYANEFIIKTRPENRICVIGGNIITSSNNYLFISLLTSNINEELSRFNLLNIDKQNLNLWLDRDLFINVASAFLNDDKWGKVDSFNYLGFIISEVKGGLL